MDYGLVQSIQDTQNKLSHWDQNPVIVDPNNKDPNSVIDLCKAVGKNAETPPNAVNQPPMYPNDSQFQFDPTTFHGKDALAPLCSLIRGFCPGCKLYLQDDGTPRKKGTTYQLRCQHYPLKHKRKQKQFKEGRFTKTGVRTEHIKQRKGSKKRKKSVFFRMHNPKMGTRASQRQKKAHDSRISTTNTSNDSDGDESMEDNDKKTTLKDILQKAYRTFSVRAEDPSYRCHMNIQFFMTGNGNWYLSTKSIFKHSYHSQVAEEARQLAKLDMNNEHLNYLQLMSEFGVPKSMIASIMTRKLNDEGMKGEFISDTVRNISVQIQKVMDEMAGISADYTVASRTIERLNQ